MDRNVKLRGQVLKAIERVYSNGFDRQAAVRQQWTRWDAPMAGLQQSIGYKVYRANQSPDYYWSAEYRLEFESVRGPMWMGTPLRPPLSAGEAHRENVPPPGPAIQGTVYISLLAPYFTMSQVEYRSGETTGWIATRVWPFGEMPAFPNEARAIKLFASGHGLTSLPEDVLDTHVPDVQLELSEPEDVTVLKCLFYDYEIEFRKPLIVRDIR